MIIALIVIAAASALLASAHALVRWRRRRRAGAAAAAASGPLGNGAADDVDARISAVFEAARVLQEQVETLRPLQSQLRHLEAGSSGRYHYGGSHPPAGATNADLDGAAREATAPKAGGVLAGL